jgi:site-specific recombinase XerD
MDIATLVEQFCDYSTFIRGYSPHTIQRYRSCTRYFATSLQLRAIEDCSEERVREFLYRGRAERHWSPHSFITMQRTLAVFFRWCVERRYLPANPADGIEMPRLPKRLPPHLTTEQATRLLEYIENYPWPYRFLRWRNHAIFATFLHAGLRKHELLRLQMVDLDLEALSIFVRQGKGAKDRVVPVTPALASSLGRYLAERRRVGKTCPEVFTSLTRDTGFTDNGWKHLVLAIRRMTGQPVRAHTLRHTFATLMMEGGCDLFTLSKMMGHSDIKTTTIYLAVSAEHLRTQIHKHPLNRTWGDA